MIKDSINSKYNFGRSGFAFGVDADKFLKADVGNIEKKSLPVLSPTGFENRGVLDFHIEPLLILVFVAGFQNFYIPVIYFLTILLALLLDGTRL